MPDQIQDSMPEDNTLQDESKAQSKGAPDTLAAGARLLGLAALGALVAIGEGSGRLFQALVEKGEKSEPAARERLAAVGRKVGQAAGNVESAVRRLGGRVRGLAERSREALDETVASGLRRAGLPAREELEALLARVDALEERLQALRHRLRPEGESRP